MQDVSEIINAEHTNHYLNSRQVFIISIMERLLALYLNISSFNPFPNNKF